MCDQKYCIVDHSTGVFVVSERVESMILNSFYAPDINHELVANGIPYRDWSESIISDVETVLDTGRAVYNRVMNYTVTAY